MSICFWIFYADLTLLLNKFGNFITPFSLSTVLISAMGETFAFNFRVANLFNITCQHIKCQERELFTGFPSINSSKFLTPLQCIVWCSLYESLVMAALNGPSLFCLISIYLICWLCVSQGVTTLPITRLWPGSPKLGLIQTAALNSSGTNIPPSVSRWHPMNKNIFVCVSNLAWKTGSRK